jgi:predicted metal-dependent peptidase
MLRDQPFYAMIAYTLPMIEVPDGGWCNTMATDGRAIYYNPAFVEELSVPKVAGVIAHECKHVAYGHMFRIGRRDPKLWNIATDYAINLHIKASRSLELPESALLDQKYKDMSAEQIYELLYKEAKIVKVKFPSKPGKDGQPSSGGSDDDEEMWGGMIEPRDQHGNPLSETELRDLEDEIKMTVKNAYATAKAAGKVPGGIEGLIEALGKPKIDWNNYIQTWIKGTRPDNYTWRRPNRNYMATQGIYLPIMELVGAGFGVLNIDVSGSVSDAELVDYVTEITGVIDMLNPDRLLIIQHDAEVKGTDEWEPGDDFSKLKIKGRGGTCIQPSINFINNLDEQPDWVISFSDMGIFDMPDEEPDYPWLWCSTGTDNHKWGQMVMLRDPMEGV